MSAKKVIISKKEYVDPNTGEVEEFVVINKKISQVDNNFHKIWLMDFLSILDMLGTKKMKVLNYLLENMRKEDNSISASYRDISKKTGVSYKTVADTMKALKESNIIKQTTNSTYQFNPDIIIKGNADKKKRILLEYEKN